MIVFKPSFFPGWTMHFNFLATLSKIPLCVECCSPPPILPDKIQTYFSLKNFFKKILFREQWKEKERERNINVWLLLVCPHWGPGPQPNHVPPPGNQTVHHLVRRPALNPLSHPSQGSNVFLSEDFYYPTGRINILLH